MSNPVSQILFAYERDLYPGHTLDDILDYGPLLGEDGYPLSGLYDLREVLQIAADSFRSHPVLTWRELEISQKTDRYGETLSTGKTYLRNLSLPTMVKQSRPSWQRGSAGEVMTQEATLYLDIASLWRAAYLPKPGDQVQWRMNLYDVGYVFVDPEHYFRQTAFPLYVTCEMTLALRDSRNTGCALPAGREAGSPARVQPLGNPQKVLSKEPL